MSLTPRDAYVLGSLPRRLCHERSASREIGDEAFAQVRRLANLWLELLDRIKDCTLRPAVEKLRDRLAAEQDWQDAQKQYETQAKLQALFRPGEASNIAPPTPLTLAPDSLQLAHELLYTADLTRRPEYARIRESLPEELRELHELGELVAACVWDMRGPDSDGLLRIWNICRRYGVEETITDRPAGSPLSAGESISRLVQVRADRIDDRFMNGPITPPKPEPEELPVGPYLTIAEVAQLLKVGEDTVERLIQSGQLKAAEISGKGVTAGRKVKRIRREAVDEYLASTEGKVQTEPPKRKQLAPKPPKDYFS